MSIGQPLPAGDSIYLSILDEVTGLAFNPQKHIMNAEDATTYSVTLPLYIGSVIKYRYSREGSGIVNEYLDNDRPVRYRMLHIEGQATVQDVVSRWADGENNRMLGRILGQVFDSSTTKPIPNLLVTAGGVQALTRANGSFLLEGLPPGTHNLVFYALDGSYNIYQQGAVVAGDSTTPVSVELAPAKFVTAIFTISVPSDTPADASIRLAGNLYQLGNTFTNLSGGVSTLAGRMPVFGKLPDGSYMLTISLPAGAYLEYKYTLGDGLWSAEMTKNSAMQLRNLLVPENDFQVKDVVDAWHKVDSNLIRFEVKVPKNTPRNEEVSIQFNPGFGWLEPIPMWLTIDAQSESVWNYELGVPFNPTSILRYRYCRQEQCGSADDEASIGIDPTGRVLDLGSNPGIVQDEVISWAWLEDAHEPVVVHGSHVNPRGPGFVAGVSFQPDYHPSWTGKFPQAIEQAKRLEVNWLVLEPTWTFTSSSSPLLEPQPFQDILWADYTSTVSTIENQGLNVGIYPQPKFLVETDLWWQNSSRDFPWWVSFFENYTNLILHYASVNVNTSSSLVILGGEWLEPALPGGALADGSPSGVPQDAEQRWRELISQVRQTYSGSIAWALPYPDGIRNPPPFLDAVDQIYLLWSAPLAEQPGAQVEDMQARANSILNQEILPLIQALGKQVVIAISYPSIDMAATGCINILGGGCLDYDLLNPSNPDIATLPLNLQEQANAYNAVISAINDNN